MSKIYENHKFEAIKLRFQDQSELLHRLTQIDLRLFIGYLTLQVLAGSWFIANIDKINSLAAKLGLLLIDASLTVVAIALLQRQKLRRKEAVETIRNCNKALGYNEVGGYLDGQKIDAESRTRFWFPWYVVGIFCAFLGFAIIVLGNSLKMSIIIQMQ